MLKAATSEGEKIYQQEQEHAKRPKIRTSYDMSSNSFLSFLSFLGRKMGKNNEEQRKEERVFI